MDGTRPGLTFAVLGPLEVRRDGAPVAISPRRHAELLALLAVRPRAVVPAEVLADQLWDGAPPPSAANTLQGYVSGLRRALEPGRGVREPARVLVTHPVGYTLDVEDAALDVAVFRSRVTEARRLAAAGSADGAVPAAVAEIRAALALWRGPALADVADTTWAQPVVRALEEERLAAQDLLADLRLAGDDLEDVVAELRRSLAEHPLRERTAAQLMRALYRTGRQAEALDVARDTRATLDEQLGVDPGPELRELELAVLRQDDGLLLTRPARRTAAPVVSRHAPAPPPGLPGREEQLSQLGRVTASAHAGSPAVVLVTGEAGIGKTRLVEAATGGLHDATVLTGRCTDLEGMPPYWPWRQVADQLGTSGSSDGQDGADPLGELAASSGDLADSGVAAGRFEQALALVRRLRDAARSRPVVLVLEDLQWADAPSLQLLEIVLGELRDAAVLVLLTARTAGPTAPYGLTRLSVALSRHPGAHRVDLGGLDDAAVAACVAEVTGREPDAATAALVRRRAGGNPFFVRELARLLGEDGRLRPGVPVAVRDVIRLRTAGLSESARDLLAAGAVLGRDVAVATVAAVLDLDATALVALVEEALAAGLLVEPVPGRLRFEHALVQEAVREDLSAARATALHARAAAALADREQPPPGVLAHHLLAAQDARGYGFAARAAELDLRQLAVEPAVEILEHALRMTGTVRAEPAGLRELRLLRGLALGRLGRLDDSRAELVGVAEEAEAAGDGDQVARAALAMAADGAVSGYWTTLAPVTGAAEEAVAWLARALGLDAGSAARLDPATRVALRSALATQLAVAGRPDPTLATAAAEEAEGTASGRPLDRPLDRHSRTRALTARWATLWTPDHAEERLGIARRLLELAGSDVPHQLAARHLLATALLEVGDVAGSDAQAAALAATVADHRNPDFALLVVWWRAMRALMSGDLAGAEEAAGELAAQTGSATGRAAATALLSSQTVAGIVAWERGVLGRSAAQLDVAGFTTHPGMQAVRALAHAQNDDPAAAHHVLREAFGPRLDRLGDDSTALSPLVLTAEVLARAGDDGQAAVLLERLTPYAGAVVVFAPGAVCMGAGTLYTGTAAALAGDLGRARTDLEDAVARNRSLGADPFTVRSLERLAVVLERAGDGAGAAARSAEARAVAAHRGLAVTGMVLATGPRETEA